MGLVTKPARQEGAAPLPEPSQPSDLATRWASDLRGFATFGQHLAKATFGGRKPYPSPALWWRCQDGVCKSRPFVLRGGR